MGISSLGPAGLDPFTPTGGPAPEEARETTATESREQAPLPEGAGTVIDTSA